MPNPFLLDMASKNARLIMNSADTDNSLFFFFFSLVSQWSIDALHIEKKKKKGNNILKNTWILCATESSMGQNTWYQILSLKRWGHLFKIYLYGADAFVTWMSIYIRECCVYMREVMSIYYCVYYCLIEWRIFTCRSSSILPM